MSDETDQLERLVDMCGLALVLDKLAEVCDAKAEHLAANWQDETSAAAWRRAALLIGRVAERDAISQVTP